MVRQNKQIETLLHQAWIASSNAERVDDIKEALDQGLFDQTRQDELKQLIELVKKRVKARNLAYDNQTELTSQRDEQHDALDQLFAMHRRQTRRILVKDSPPYRKLGLDGSRSDRLMIWFRQIRSFYGLLLADEDFKEVASRYRLSTDFLTRTLAQIDELERLHNKQQQAIRKARQSTKDRDAAVNDLEKVYLDMKDIACHQLKDQPHYLEAMGFIDGLLVVKHSQGNNQ